MAIQAKVTLLKATGIEEGGALSYVVKSQHNPFIVLLHRP